MNKLNKLVLLLVETAIMILFLFLAIDEIITNPESELKIIFAFAILSLVYGTLNFYIGGVDRK